MLKAYEEQIGKIKLQQLPSGNSNQMEDESEVLRELEDKSEVLQEQEKIGLFRSIFGSGIYLCQERYDTAMSSRHWKKFLGDLKKTMDYCLALEFPQGGEGYEGENYWCLEILRFRLEWKQKGHRKSTSGGFHAVNGCPLFNSSSAEDHELIFM